MLAWMDDEALHRTLTTGRATYWSRSRGEYWVKGDTSGHVQHVKAVSLDCDGDTVLLKVDQVGAACHTGDRTCFDADRLRYRSRTASRPCARTGRNRAGPDRRGESRAAAREGDLAGRRGGGCLLVLVRRGPRLGDGRARPRRPGRVAPRRAATSAPC